MNITGGAVTKKEYDRLAGFAGATGADNIAIGYMKMEDEKFYPVARFFKGDKYLFYVTL